VFNQIQTNRNRVRKAPLIAAFFISVIGIPACTTLPEFTQVFTDVCEQDAIPISTIQGQSDQSALTGQRVILRGIVTFVDPAAGVYLEQPLADLSPDTSDAIFVRSAELSNTLDIGMLVGAYGQVSELGAGADTQTALDPVLEHRVCRNGLPVPNSDARLPLTATEREALENMRVTLIQPLYVTDVYRLHQGQLSLSADDVLWQPTEIQPPGTAAVISGQVNRLNSIAVQLKSADIEASPVGSPVPGITGVLGHDGHGIRLQADALSWSPPGNTGSIGSPADGVLRVVSFNLENYFNGDGLGGGFPTERGAESPEAFLKQRGRLSEAIRAMKPHLLAVMELENDGFGHNGAAHDLVHAISSFDGPKWSVVQPHLDRIGGDDITVGMFYDADALEPEGPAHVLDAPDFDGLSRQPLAQVFVHPESGRRILAAVNHFKSKGSCPASGINADQGDGQGCWNDSRTRAATAMSEWVKEIAASRDIDDILILGDLNAYRQEQPIQTITESGFVELVAASNPGRKSTYVHFGAAGTLDYAFASESLADDVSNAQIWRINSVWPSDMTLPQPWLHSSDHDPVIVDFQLSHSADND
jgi:predicted extracellular nuclease